jgi:hypothetical protein
LGVDLGPIGTPFSFEELDSSSHLFLAEIYEPKVNYLRLVICEGKTSKSPVPVRVAGVDFGRGFPVEIHNSCAAYQLHWASYVLYQVLNETFVTAADASEIYERKLARRYTTSKLLQSLLGSTHAANENPGKPLALENFEG